MTSGRGPAVLIVGGLMTSPPLYWMLARRLRRRGASKVAIAPVFGLHWLIGAFGGLGPSTSIVARAIDRLSEADGGRPILLVGHSAGGILARLALAPVPFDRAQRPRPGSVGAVVTLGAPHLATRVDGTFGRQGVRALRFLAQNGEPSRSADGSPGWLTVGSTFPADRSVGAGRYRRRRVLSGLARVGYVALLGPAGRHAHGDGMVPFECTALPDVAHITLTGIAHGPIIWWGARWYGSDEAVDRWWGPAVEAWRTAVAERNLAA